MKPLKPLKGNRPRKITGKGNLLLLAFNRISIFNISEHRKEGCIIPKRPRCEALAKWRVTKLHVVTGAWSIKMMNTQTSSALIAYTHAVSDMRTFTFCPRRFLFENNAESDGYTYLWGPQGEVNFGPAGPGLELESKKLTNSLILRSQTMQRCITKLYN